MSTDSTPVPQTGVAEDVPAGAAHRRFGARHQSARLWPGAGADRHHDLLPVHHVRHAVQAGEPQQSGAAEQLHHRHGARHAAGDRFRPHRPQRRLGGGLHRRARGHDDGDLAARLLQQSAGRVDRLPGDRRRYRRGAGLLDRLSPHTELHRHAGRHADVPRHVPGAAGRRLLRRPASRQLQGPELGLHPRPDRHADAHPSDRERGRQDDRRQRPVAAHDDDRDRGRRRAGLCLFRAEGTPHARAARL